MEKTHLCSKCGEKILESEKYCSKCGAVDYHNYEISAKIMSENTEYYSKVKKSVRVVKALKAIGFGLILLSISVDVIFAFSIAFGGGAYDVIRILPISGIALIIGFIMVYVFKTN